MLTEEVKQAILETLPGAYVEVLDPMNDQTHLEALVVAKEFESISLVKQHQLVMRALKSHFHESLHALKLKTVKPSQFQKSN